MCFLLFGTENTLLFQINNLNTENFWLVLCGGRMTTSSTTESPQTAKALCKKEYIAISFLFLLFSAFFAAVGYINTSFFFIENQPFIPKEPWMVAWAFSEFWMFGFLQQRIKMTENFSSSSEGCVWLTSYWMIIRKVLNSPDSFSH